MDTIAADTLVPETLGAMASKNRPVAATAANITVGRFEDLYRCEYSPMVKLARRLLDSTEAAEEVVQDAFARVYERWSRLDEPGGYLRTAVVNGARSELRKREVRRRVGLDRRAEVSEPQDYLLDALGQLPVKQKTVLVLRFYADMTEKEISEILGIRLGTVKSSTSRGLMKLRKALEQ